MSGRLLKPDLNQYFIIVLKFTDFIPDIIFILNLIHPISKNTGRLVYPPQIKSVALNKFTTSGICRDLSDIHYPGWFLSIKYEVNQNFPVLICFESTKSPTYFLVTNNSSSGNNPDLSVVAQDIINSVKNINPAFFISGYLYYRFIFFRVNFEFICLFIILSACKRYMLPSVSGIPALSLF